MDLQEAILNDRTLAFTQTTFTTDCSIPQHTCPQLISRNEIPFNYSLYLPSWPTDACIFTDSEAKIEDDDLISQLVESTVQLQNIPYSQNLRDILRSTPPNYSALIRASRATFSAEISKAIDTEAVPVQFEAIAEYFYSQEKNENPQPQGGVGSYLNFLQEICPVCMKFCCKIHEFSGKSVFQPEQLKEYRNFNSEVKSFKLPLYLQEIQNPPDIDFNSKSGRKEYFKRQNQFLATRKVDLVDFPDLKRIYGEKIKISKRFRNGKLNLSSNYEITKYCKQILTPSTLNQQQIDLIPIITRITDGNIPLISSLLNSTFDEILLQIRIKNLIKFDSTNCIFGTEIPSNWTDPLPGFQLQATSKIREISTRTKSDFAKFAKRQVMEVKTGTGSGTFPGKAMAPIQPILEIQPGKYAGGIFGAFTAEINSQLDQTPTLSINQILKSNFKQYQPLSDSLQHQTFSPPCYHPGLYCSPIWCTCAQNHLVCTFACGCYQNCHLFWPGCTEIDTIETSCYLQGCCCSPDSCAHYKQQQLLLKHLKPIFLPPISQLSIRISFPLRIGLTASPIHGFGISCLTTTKLNIGMPFFEYNGEIVSQEEAEKRGRISDAYGLTYLFTLSQGPELDAGLRGGIARYMNHLDKANVRTRLFRYGSENMVFMIANQRIMRGELFFNYGKQFKSDVAEVVLKKVVQ